MQLKFVKTLLIYFGVIGTISAGPAQASQIIRPFDSGWYNDDGRHSPGNVNFIVGSFVSHPSEILNTKWNNFFAFDLASLAGQQITSATLTIFAGIDQPSVSGNGLFLYESTNIAFYDNYSFEGNIDHLLTDRGHLAAYNDLADGKLYGHSEIEGIFSLAMPEVKISFTEAAILDMNAALLRDDKRFVIGGTATNAVQDDRLWGGSGRFELADAALTLTAVPIPTALPLLLTALAGLGFMGWRRN